MKMSSLIGSYVFVKSENLEDFALKVLGPDAADGVKEFYPNSSTLHFSISHDKLNFGYTIGDNHIFNAFRFDSEFEEKTFFKNTLKTVVNKYSDAQYNFFSTTFEGNIFIRTFVLSSENLTVNFSEPKFGLISKMFYKRI